MHEAHPRKCTRGDSLGGVGDRATVNRSSRSLFDVLHTWRGVHVQLATALAQQELNGTKIAFVELDILLKLGSGSWSACMVMRDVGLGVVPREGPKVLAALGWLFAAFPQALPVQAEHLFLETRQPHGGEGGCDKTG